MAFIYEFEYKVHSVIDNLSDDGLPYGEPEISISTLDGFMKIVDDEIIINYAETVEGDKVFTELRVEDDTVTLVRHGALESKLVFCVGEPYKTVYTAAGYSFDMLLTTKKIRSNLTKSGGELQLIYTMTVGGAAKSARMKITARPKERK